MLRGEDGASEERRLEGLVFSDGRQDFDAAVNTASCAAKARLKAGRLSPRAT